MKIKIGIITILRANNYGAELQAFSLQKKLDDLGYKAEIIDYLFYKHKDYIKTPASKPFFDISPVNKLKEFLLPILNRIKSIPYQKQKELRDQKFDDFHKKYTVISQKTYKSIDSLYTEKFDYDIIISGSDQIWNPRANTSLKPYFLDFVEEGILKVSFASSFGVGEIPAAYKPIYANLLSGFDKLSCREDKGVEAIKEMTGKEVTHVLDPTFLFSKQEWMQFSTPYAAKRPYVLLYVLTDSQYITNLAKKIARDWDLDIVRLCKNASVEDKNSDIINVIDAGPSEFLGYFEKAAFVLTTSFHGTCFSVNFKIPFYVILKSAKTNNNRQESLLSSLNIEDRILEENQEMPSKETYNIDYDQCTPLIDQQVETSINYLKDIEKLCKTH